MSDVKVSMDAEVYEDRLREHRALKARVLALETQLGVAERYLRATNQMTGEKYCDFCQVEEPEHDCNCPFALLATSATPASPGRDEQMVKALAGPALEISRLTDERDTAIAELVDVLREAEICLTTTFRDGGRRHDEAIVQVRALIAKYAPPSGDQTETKEDQRT